MSADNYIYIDTKTFEVWHCVASCVCNHKKHCLECQKLSLLGKGVDLPNAMNITKKFIQDWVEEGLYVEYGFSTDLWCK